MDLPPELLQRIMRGQSDRTVASFSQASRGAYESTQRIRDCRKSAHTGDYKFYLENCINVTDAPVEDNIKMLTVASVDNNRQAVEKILRRAGVQYTDDAVTGLMKLLYEEVTIIPRPPSPYDYYNIEMSVEERNRQYNGQRTKKYYEPVAVAAAKDGLKKLLGYVITIWGMGFRDPLGYDYDFYLLIPAMKAAAENGHLDIVKFLYESQEGSERGGDIYGQIIYLALVNNHLPIVRYLMDRIPFPNQALTLLEDNSANLPIEMVSIIREMRRHQLQIEAEYERNNPPPMRTLRRSRRR